MSQHEQKPQIDDEDLALRMMDGNEDALICALKAYGPKIKGFLWKQFGDQLDKSELDHVFQTSLVKFWRRISTYDTEKGSLRGWWIRIARNSAIDHIRGIERYQERFKAEEIHDPADDNDDECGDIELTDDSKEKKCLERIDDFIRNKLVGIEQTVALNCFAIGGDPDIVRLAAKLGKTRSYIDTVKSKVRKKIIQFVLAIDA